MMDIVGFPYLQKINVYEVLNVQQNFSSKNLNLGYQSRALHSIFLLIVDLTVIYIYVSECGTSPLSITTAL